MSRNYQSNAKADLLLKEKVKKEGVLRNNKSNSENRLAASRDNARLGMSNLCQRRRVGELPEQRETRLAAKRESKKRRRAEESQEQQENRLAAS